MYRVKKEKPLQKLTLNALDIEVYEGNRVIIYDKIDDVNDLEAQKICAYLYKEGFFNGDCDDVTCEIVKI